MYRATKAPWAVAQYRSLDRIISFFYRKIFKVERTFPEALIYMSLKDCGLGMKRFSDNAQRLKWSAIQRLLTSKGDSGAAATSSRGPAVSSLVPQPRRSLCCSRLYSNGLKPTAYPSSRVPPLTVNLGSQDGDSGGRTGVSAGAMSSGFRFDRRVSNYVRS
jgi:hypothetical protein